MLYVFIFGFLVPHGNADVSANMAEWKVLEDHPMINREHLSNADLEYILAEEFDKLRVHCDAIPEANIVISFDASLMGSPVLAWASQTIVIGTDALWYPSILKDFFTGTDMTLGIQPSPPNGWYTQSDSCSSIGWRYDLRTILRHELLHGLAISSSLYKDSTSWSVGHFFSGLCFPRLFDSKITDSNGEHVIDGCSVGDMTDKELYVGGVKLYNPSVFNAGSSISHHDHYGHLMYYAISSRTCLDVDIYELQMLDSLGIHCGNFSASRGTTSSPFLITSFLPSLFLLLWLSCFFY
jgi:hypothetical protein